MKEGRAVNVGYAIISAVRDQLNRHAEQDPDKVGSYILLSFM